MQSAEWQFSVNAIYHLDRNYEIVVTILRKHDMHDKIVQDLIALCKLYMKDAWSIACFESYDYFITIRSWDKLGLKELTTNHPLYFKNDEDKIFHD
jgi:hypothetical protein